MTHGRRLKVSQIFVNTALYQRNPEYVDEVENILGGVSSHIVPSSRSIVMGICYEGKAGANPSETSHNTQQVKALA